MAILVAIDENERSKEIVEIGCDLAARYDDTLIALHVVPTEEYEKHKNAVEDIPDLTGFSLDQEAESAEEFARRFVRETIGDAGDVDIEYRGRVGDIADEILAEAATVEPRYLVISGRQRSPVGKAVFGNTTQRVLLNTDCPVVTKLV